MRDQSNIVGISAIITSYNEEPNIRTAIESVLWAEKVFVVDSFSTDKTVEIAKEYAPKVEVVQHEFICSAAQLNWALDNLPIKTEWVFILDSDEIVTPRLRDEILRTVANPKHDAYTVRRLLRFLGKWIRFAGRSTPVVRLFRKDKARYEMRKVNAHPIVNGSIGHLRSWLLHWDRKPLTAFLRRHNRFSSAEAEERYKVWFKGIRDAEDAIGGRAKVVRFIKNSIWPRLPVVARCTAIFLWRYLFCFGFLDGLPGLFYCLHHAAHELYINMKTYELRLRERGKV